MATNEFQESLKRYKEKKEACIAFLKKAEDTAAAYAAQFPPVDEAEKEDSLPGKFDALAKRVESARLKILVAGQFKMGKSTVINALLGENVLPAYSTPCTAVITEIEYGDEKKAVLSFKSPLQELPPNLAPKVAAHIGERRTDIPDLVIESDNLGEELEEYLVIPEDEDDRDQKEAVAESPYALCRLSWPLELCKNDVEIIDSPGLNEATARDETTYKYVPQADMIIHVLTSLQLYGKYDKEFVTALGKNGKPPLIFLVNRFDQLNTDKERERVRNYAAKNLTEATPYGDEGIFFVSAYKALMGRTEHSPTLYGESGFREFERKLAETVARDRGKIKLAGNLRAASDILNNLSRNLLPELRKKMDSDVAELEKKFAAQQKEFEKLNDKKERIQRTIELGLGNVRRVMNAEIRGFFNNFANESLEDYVNEAQFDIAFFNRKESQKRAVEIMSEEMLSGLRREFDEFNRQKSIEMGEMLADIADRVRDQIEEFNEMLNAIRLDLDMDVDARDLSISHRDIGDVDFGDLVGEGLAGAMVGGGLSVGAVFLASRFFAFLGGPIGWGITILSTVGAALLAILNSTAAVDKMKAEYVRAARNKLKEDAGAWATQLTDELAADLDQHKQQFMAYLNDKIENTKNPILEAIELMKNTHLDLDEKKKQLEEFREKFADLDVEAKQLEASL